MITVRSIKCNAVNWSSPRKVTSNPDPAKWRRTIEYKMVAKTTTWRYLVSFVSCLSICYEFRTENPIEQALHWDVKSKLYLKHKVNSHCFRKRQSFDMSQITLEITEPERLTSLLIYARKTGFACIGLLSCPNRHFWAHSVPVGDNYPSCSFANQAESGLNMFWALSSICGAVMFAEPSATCEVPTTVCQAYMTAELFDEALEGDNCTRRYRQGKTLNSD